MKLFTTFAVGAATIATILYAKKHYRNTLQERAPRTPTNQRVVFDQFAEELQPLSPLVTPIVRITEEQDLPFTLIDAEETLAETSEFEIQTVPFTMPASVSQLAK